MATARAERPGRLLEDGRLTLPDWLSRIPDSVLVGAFLLILCAASIWLRTTYINDQYWMDEALSVGIASHPLTAIPGVLRMDGSPPLFYLALHIWMSMFGNSAAATHSMSLLFGMLTVPVSWWGARSMFGTRAAVFTAFVFATNPFVTVYSEETRMYSLMVLLGLIATIGLLQGFVFRRRKYVALFAVSQALMLYTHAWALFYGAGSFIALIVLWRISDEDVREHFIRDAVLAYGGAGLLYLPWLPNFLFQTSHTAAPWDVAPRLGAPIQLSRGVMGGDRVTAAIVAPAVIGFAGLVGRRARHSREARLMWMLIVLPTLTLLLAWAASQITPAWVPRYFAPIVPSILLLGALGMSRAGAIGTVGLILALAFLLFPQEYAPAYKSNMKDVAGEMAPLLHRGDIVVVGQPEETPLAYYYLPAGLRFTNPSTRGLLADPTYMNWVNALHRMRSLKPRAVVPKLLDSMHDGQQLLFIRSLTEGAGNWKAPWTAMVRRRASQWGAIIGDDRQFVPVAWAPHNYRGACCVANSAVLYKKVS